MNIDFNSSPSNNYTGLAAAPDTAGAAAHWNSLINVSGTASSVALNDSTNVATGIGFSLSGINGTVSNAAPQAERGASASLLLLMRDYLSIDSANARRW